MPGDSCLLRPKWVDEKRRYQHDFPISSSLLLFLPVTDTCSLYQFLISVCISVHIHHWRWDWVWSCFGEGTWLSWDYNLILWHSDFIIGVIRLVVFIWMANRLFHCLRTWKLISQGQHKAAELAWVLSCGKYEPGHPRGLGELQFARDQEGQSNWRFPGGLGFAMTWPGSKAQINMGLSFLLLLLLLKNLLVYNLHIKEMCQCEVFGSMRFYKCTHLSHHQNQGCGWLFLLLCSTAPFSLPALKLSIPHLHRRRKRNPTAEKFITCLEKIQSLMFDKNCWMH